MRVALYARVSTTRQAQAQGIEQQLDRLRAAAAERGWELEDQHVYRDDGYSGARIGRPGLDRLRDHAALAELDLVLVTAPDRLARNYVHQVLLIDELAGRGCQVEFLDRPMSADPHDQLLLQIRGAVAEDERTLIAERARRRRSARPRAGPGIGPAPRPEEDWIPAPVPAIVSEEPFARVQAKLDANQRGAARTPRHEYLLRALISCGACRLGCTGRQTAAGYRYYLCRGRTDPLRVAQGERCTARYIPAGQLDELVWADLCALLTDPAQVTRALDRAQGGAWLPQELHARQTAIRQALGQLDRQQQRLLDAYLAEIIALAEFQIGRAHV